MKPLALMMSTTCWTPAARLAIALAGAGFDVQAVCPPLHPMRGIRTLNHAYRYNGLTPRLSFGRAIEAARPDVVVPCDDHAAQILHRLHYEESGRDRTSGFVVRLIETSVGSPTHFLSLYDRAELPRLAEEECIRAPKTVAVKNEGALGEALSLVGLPALLKTNGSSGGAGVRMAAAADEARQAFKALSSPPMAMRAAKRGLFDGDWNLLWPAVKRLRPAVNAQAYVHGREATSAAVCWKGEVLAAVHFEVLHRMYANGPATAVRRILHPEMTSGIVKIARRLGLSGIHGFDFILESGTGEPSLIELNPRAPQVSHLCFADQGPAPEGLGQDLPAALFAAVSGKAPQPSSTGPDQDTIALFPNEWLRDPLSPILQSGYHDVPWDEPVLVAACLAKRPGNFMRAFEKEWLSGAAASRVSRAKAT